jgi:hypothetical protein
VEFEALLDVSNLKRSVAAQLVRTHMKLAGRDQRLSPLAQNLAMQAGMALADAYVVEIVKADALIDLLRHSRRDASASPTPGLSGWSLPNLRAAAKLLASEYRGMNFYVSVPLAAPKSSSYRLRLRLQRWDWKLAGIELPEQVQVRLVQEYQRRREAK